MKRILFWVASFIWGLPMSFLGSIIAIGLLITGHKPKRFYQFIYFEVGKNWGGFSCGVFFFTSKNPSFHTKQHEAGHGIQNIMFGFLMPFIVSIPSALRYWYRELTPNKKHPDYYSIWFENQANKLGEKYFK